MHAGGPLSRKGFPETDKEGRREESERGGGRCVCGMDARDATTRPSSLGSDGSSMAMSAYQTEGTRMHRRARAAMRKAMDMTSIAQGREREGGRGRWWDVVVWSEKGQTQDRKGEELNLPH